MDEIGYFTFHDFGDKWGFHPDQIRYGAHMLLSDTDGGHGIHGILMKDIGDAAF